MLAVRICIGRSHCGHGKTVWCSTLRRTVETANAFKKKARVYQWKALNEINAGVCEGMTYEDIQSKYPEEYNERNAHKLTYRYPQGESYLDVIQRLEPVIFELERTTHPVLVIAHRAVLRCLYAYFMDEPIQNIPYIQIKLHTVYRLSPGDYKTHKSEIPFGLVASKTTPHPSITS